MRKFRRAQTKKIVTNMEMEEVTVERRICWQHGEGYIRDDGDDVRLPIFADECGTCSGFRQ